ncbi:unnamed protein product [Lymnaea stagnalis]|uniref:Folylpolyglutamate synthase n=1 Tax=Lymnaea stagnalis TaxID=6523 RepID=A0AAV2IK07_LYMST
MKALFELQSNAESIAKARQSQDKKFHNIPNMKKYITRSGLMEDQVDNLSVIHVSGTKGKGSTCAFCERILSCHGYKTGLFTSPHLVEVRERIRINGRPVSKELFSEYFWKVYTNLKDTQTENIEGGGMPAYFPFLTVLSLHVFISEGVDVAVMEVGIGGQYDSTNFVKDPVVCGVTSLGLDHTSMLGNTIEEIAWSKAGIFKKGHPAITVPQDSKAMKVLLDRSIEILNPLYLAVPVSEELLAAHKIHLGIAGAKQGENASLAIQLYRMWVQRHSQKELSLDVPLVSSTEDIPKLFVDDLDEGVLQGLMSCVWPGRTQSIRRMNITYYLDGAHTMESMEVCTAWFQEAADKETRAIDGLVGRVLIFNATGDRDVGPFLNILKDCSFDAALFCTNLLSTVESLNRPDQMNRTVTVKGMLERAQNNKVSWDSLFESDASPKPELDHNFNSKNILENDDDGALSEQPQLLNHPTDCSLSIDRNEDLRVVEDSDSSEKQTEISHVESAHTGSVKHMSLAFPCIMEALAWATQGRDPLLDFDETTKSLVPEVPRVLLEKDHIQVLITGSLHLVGGVLGVLAPNMND